MQRGWGGGCLGIVVCVNMLLQWRIATGSDQTRNAQFSTTDTDKGVTGFSLSCIFAESWDSWSSQQSSPASSVQEAVINLFFIMKHKRLLNIKFCFLAFKFYFAGVQWMQIPLITLKYMLYFDISSNSSWLFSSNVHIFTDHKHIKGNKLLFIIISLRKWTWYYSTRDNTKCG